MDKSIREQLQKETKEYLKKIDFVKVHSDIKMTDAEQNILFKWIDNYEHLLRESYYHRYWQRVLWAEKSYRMAKENREEAERCHQMLMGMEMALECAGYETLPDWWIKGEGRFKNVDFVTYEIVSKFRRGF